MPSMLRNGDGSTPGAECAAELDLPSCTGIVFKGVDWDSAGNPVCQATDLHRRLQARGVRRLSVAAMNIKPGDCEWAVAALISFAYWPLLTFLLQMLCVFSRKSNKRTTNLLILLFAT